MFQTEQEKLKKEIIQLTGNYERKRTALLPILQNIQAKYHHISDFAMQEIADLLNIHPVEVYGVVTFYSFLRTESTGKFVIKLCKTISCEMAGKEKVERQLQNELGIGFGETSPDGHFSLEYANCLGLCDQGPALLVNDIAFSKVTAEKVHDIIDGCKRAFTSFAKEGEFYA